MVLANRVAARGKLPVILARLVALLLVPLVLERIVVVRISLIQYMEAGWTRLSLRVRDVSLWIHAEMLHPPKVEILVLAVTLPTQNPLV